MSDDLHLYIRKEFISRGSSSDPEYGDISAVVEGKKFKHAIYKYISLGLGSDPRWGDISSHPELSGLSERQSILLSLGLGSLPEYGDISKIVSIVSIPIKTLYVVSLGLGVMPEYGDITGYSNYQTMAHDAAMSLSRMLGVHTDTINRTHDAVITLIDET